MTLSLYLARRFAGTFLLILGVFAGMAALIDMVEQLRRMAGRDGTFLQAAHLAVVNVPATLYQILPLMVILAAIALFLALARSSELVVIRATGRSGVRLVMAPVAAVLVIGAVTLAAINPLVAYTIQHFETLSNRYTGGETGVISVGASGLWLRQAHPGGQLVIRAARADADGTGFTDVTFMTFGESGPERRIEAARAELEAGAWRLSDAKEWRLGDANPERESRRFAALELASDMTLEQLRDSFGAPAAVPIWQLPGFIGDLGRAGFSARAHRVWLQIELATPLTMAAMVMLGAALTMRHSRFGGTGMRVLLAILAGFGVFFVRNFAQVLGENGQLPVALAAWGPPGAALLLSLALLLHLEDG